MLTESREMVLGRVTPACCGRCCCFLFVKRSRDTLHIENHSGQEITIEQIYLNFHTEIILEEVA